MSGKRRRFIMIIVYSDLLIELYRLTSSMVVLILLATAPLKLCHRLGDQTAKTSGEYITHMRE